MKERRVKLGESGISVRIQADKFECLQICPMFLNGFCNAFDEELQFLNQKHLPSPKYFRLLKCVNSELELYKAKHIESEVS